MPAMPALSSDTEPDSDTDNDNDSSDDDDDDVPWTNKLSSNINRREQERPPGCLGMVPEDEDPVDIDSVEHQEAILRAFNEIAEVFEAQEKERVAKSQGESRNEEESSTYPHGDVGIQSGVNEDFNSEDDDALLKCAESKEDTELIFENM